MESDADDIDIPDFNKRQAHDVPRRTPRERDLSLGTSTTVKTRNNVGASYIISMMGTEM